MTDWRKVCESTLRTVTEADANRFWGISHPGDEGGRPIFNYRFEHTLAVVKIARWLGPLVGADLDILECSAWLHDCRKPFRGAEGETRGSGKHKDTHAQDASEAVPGILARTDFPAAKIPAVRHAIEHHVGLKLTHRLEPVETACLWDADKLSKIGAASLVHFGCIAGAFGPVSTGGILTQGQAWMERARTIAASMNTAPARLEAERRVAFLATHYEQLGREWADPMEASPS
jgi:uncharacterized protein